MTDKQKSKAIVLKSTEALVNLDRAIVVRGSGNEIRRIKSFMRLCEEDGTMVRIIPGRPARGRWPATPPTYIPTANGYMNMAAKCGVVVHHPDTVIVDGVEQPNGYKGKDGTYYFRAQAGGFTANGQRFKTDRTIDYNVHRYNIQDLLAKAKIENFARYFQMLPYEGRDDKGKLLGGPEEGKWAGYQLDEAMVLWVDCKALELVKWYGEMNNRIKNAVRTAQTFADRNAVAAHPSLPTKKKFTVGNAVVDCVSWYAPKGDITQLLLEGGGDVQIDEAHASLNDEELREVVAAESAAAPVDQTDAAEMEEEPSVDEEPSEEEQIKEGPPEAEKAQAAAEAAKPEAGDLQHAELLKSINTLAKHKKNSFQKACETLEMDPDDLADYVPAKLAELLKLLQAA